MNLKKVEPLPAPEKPEWAPIQGRPHWFLHKDGVKKAYMPPEPPPEPRVKTPAEEFFEMFAAHAIHGEDS